MGKGKVVGQVLFMVFKKIRTYLYVHCSTLMLEFGRCIQEHVARCKKSHCRRHLSPTKYSGFPWLRRGIRSWRSRAETVKCGCLVVTVQYTPCHPSPYSTNHSPATEKGIFINLRHLFYLSRFISHFSSPYIITPSPIST